MQNIRSAFILPGIFPLNLIKVLSILKKTTPLLVLSNTKIKRKTPGSIRAVRRTIKAISKEESDITQAIQLIIRVTEKLVIRNEILEHQNRALYEVLIGKKKR